MDFPVGKQIYMDNKQCEKFGAQYFKKHWTAIKSSDLLETKKGGYDEEHTEIINSCDGKYIVIERHSGEAPGWYTITKVVRV